MREDCIMLWFDQQSCCLITTDLTMITRTTQKDVGVYLRVEREENEVSVASDLESKGSNREH